MQGASEALMIWNGSERLTGGHVDFTIGSALDLFGGKIPYEKMRMFCDLVYERFINWLN